MTPGPVGATSRVRAARDERLRGLAVVLAGCSALALTVGVALHIANRGSPVNEAVTDWWLMSAAAALSYGAAGTWLTLARPRLSIGWLLLAVGVGQAWGLGALEYAVRALDTGQYDWIAVAALWFANWVWAGAIVTVGAVLPLLLPDGRLLSRRWRPALVLACSAVVTQVVTWAVLPYGEYAPALEVAGATNPTGIGWAAEPWVEILGGGILAAALLTSFSAFVIRWRRAGHTARMQLKWIALGLGVTAVLFGLGLAFGPWVTALATIPLPAACFVAAIRSGLWDVDLVISRSLQYGALTGLVVVAYVACVGLLGGVLGRTTGAPIVATAIVAIAAEPLHRRLRSGVNRLVYGAPEDPFAVLTRLGQRLESAQDAEVVSDQVLPQLVRSLAGALRLDYAAVVLADRSVVEFGRQAADGDRLPLVYGGVEVGRLVLSPPAGRRRGDRAILEVLARQTAVAAHTVLLERDLRRSREQLVTAREEERRRLYRDLHDGLGPTLAALGLQVETARDLTSEDPHAAARVLDRALPRLKGAVADVREVVHGLRPPALDELGLSGALTELAARFAGPRLAVHVHTSDLGSLPAAVEVAAYRIAAEALTNAARHSAATRVDVSISREDAALTVRVVDDGTGFSQVAGNGIGITSMQSRSQELGGSFSVSATEGGTVVEARLPAGATTGHHAHDTSAALAAGVQS